MTDHKPVLAVLAMEKAGSYIKDETLKELRGRFKFVLTPLNVHLAKITDPPEPVPPELSEKDQAAMDGYGVTHQEMVILTNHAMSMAFENELVAQKLRELFQVTRLCADDKLGEALTRYRRGLEQERQRVLKADAKYQGKLRSNEARRKSMANAWNGVENQVRVRWRRTLKGLEAALARYEFIDELHERDQDVLRYLAAYYGGHIAIEGRRVTKFDREMLVFIPVEKLHHIVESLLEGRKVSDLRCLS